VKNPPRTGSLLLLLVTLASLGLLVWCLLRGESVLTLFALLFTAIFGGAFVSSWYKARYGAYLDW
jgi:hypothetical protein